MNAKDNQTNEFILCDYEKIFIWTQRFTTTHRNF